MIKFQKGDILHADAEALVNTVNCVGIMGRGIALQFRKEFPENYQAYKAVCDRNELEPGQVLVFDLNRFENPRYILNFPTKRHWKDKSRIEYIQSGLKALIEEIRQRKIQSVAIPPLGCGLGGLDWNDVKPLIENAFRELLEVKVLIYEPLGAPTAEEMVIGKKAPKMTVARAALIRLMRRYLAAVMDPYVSLLEIHKFMYFLQEVGEPLKLKYNKATYGPYAQNLRHLLTEIEGYFISGYADAEDNPAKQIELKTKAPEMAESYLVHHPDTKQRLNQVINLIEGFETAYGMELLATVHWLASKEDAVTADQIVSKFYAWNTHKRIFKEADILLAWEVLQQKGWIKN
jgi:O-acetyl-ADP-ribose deacetylase (regulator of RNase III)